MNITSGNYRIFDSGVVFSFNNLPVKFTLDPHLQLTLSFKDDANNADTRIESVSHGVDHGELVLINFNSFTGNGYLEPAIIGNIGAENVYLYFAVYKFGSEKPTKKIEYTFYLGGHHNGH